MKIWGTPHPEPQIIHEFRHFAPVILEHQLPSDEDRLGWLVHMQHYLTPTRLLDWTESVLIALFFAVSDNLKEDGELWAVHAQGLNEASGIPGFPLPGASRHLLYLCDQPHWNGNESALAEHCKLDEPVTKPLAIRPQLLFPRMAAQLSVFTIHPSREDGHGIARALENEPTKVVRYIIPESCKDRLRWDLYHLGVTDVRVFPDAEALSRTIGQMTRILAYSPPQPPECDGVYEEVKPSES